jgi:hypothetical protein
VTYLGPASSRVDLRRGICASIILPRLKHLKPWFSSRLSSELRDPKIIATSRAFSSALNTFAKASRLRSLLLIVSGNDVPHTRNFYPVVTE